MNPIFIVDGYNLILNVDQIKKYLEKDMEEARFNLELLIRNYLALKDVKIYLVYDGARTGYIETKSSKNFRIIFSKPNEEADILIKRLVKQFPNKNRVFVVTLDRDILDFAKRQGALSMTPREFYHRIIKREQLMAPGKKYDANLSNEEVKEWLDLFEKHDPEQGVS